ncbi:MAG: hypothetical protein AAGF74_17135 [Pseudomonadota bacterium]
MNRLILLSLCLCAGCSVSLGDSTTNRPPTTYAADWSDWATPRTAPRSVPKSVARSAPRATPVARQSVQCTPDRAYRFGRRGQALPRACRAGNASRQVAAYRAGRSYHDLGTQIAALEARERRVVRELQDQPKRKKKRRAALKADRDRIRKDIARIKRMQRAVALPY